MNKIKFSLVFLLVLTHVGGAKVSWAETIPVATDYLDISINSNGDEIKADEGLTLREAISLINGQLKLEQLSSSERQQVKVTQGRHSLKFQLPAGNSKIALDAELPAIDVPNVLIDGGSNETKSVMQDLVLETPGVEIAPAPGKQIRHGLALRADNISVRGLSLYGFRVGDNDITQNIPAADIFIGTNNYPQLDDRPEPRNITIENNFLGLRADRSMPENTSDFGVYVFNSQGTTIRRNGIAYHSASGIISQINANNLLVENNAIFGNGTQGMPDAIRLEGRINNNRIQGNLICGNDGSGVFVFKPDHGSVQILNNRFESNGRRLRRAAIHLMGNDNSVVNNDISFQAGAGVAISAFAQPQMRDTPGIRNRVTNNRFGNLEGLSIDLVTYRNDGVEDFQDGDGVNPQRNTNNRRLDTANGAIDAPRFLANEFYLLNGQVNLDGQADPGTKIEIYQVNGSQQNLPNGPLSQLLQTVTTDSEGRFQATLDGVKPGTVLSAIATDDRYGTSEPATNVVVNLPGQQAQPTVVSNQPSNCTLQAQVVEKAAVPVVPAPTPTPTQSPEVPVAPPVTTRIQIPRKVHFALDKSHISPASAKLLDEVAEVLKANPYITVDLSGHTDPRAPQAYNQALGLRRATAVRNYLLKRGVAPNRMTIRSMSFKKRYSNDSGVQPYALDRRVEFDYQDMRGGEIEAIDSFDDLQPER
jgi:outer membrane protein OmpA-like peptidoglycan-associated protein